MLNFAFTEIGQVRSPLRILLEVVRDAFGEKDVTGIAAIHHALGHVNPGAGHNRALIHVFHGTDRAAMNSHAHAQLRVIRQGFTDLERAFHRRFRLGEKRERHSVTRRKPHQFPG